MYRWLAILNLAHPYKESTTVLSNCDFIFLGDEFLDLISSCKGTLVTTHQLAYFPPTFTNTFDNPIIKVIIQSCQVSLWESCPRTINIIQSWLATLASQVLYIYKHLLTVITIKIKVTEMFLLSCNFVHHSKSNLIVRWMLQYTQCMGTSYSVIFTHFWDFEFKEKF